MKNEFRWPPRIRYSEILAKQTDTALSQQSGDFTPELIPLKPFSDDGLHKGGRLPLRRH